jgi:hypothetical protein
MFEQLFGPHPHPGDGTVETQILAAVIGLAFVIAGLRSERVRELGMAALVFIRGRLKKSS